MNLTEVKVNQITFGYNDLSGKHATVEVSEWGNYEGYTIAIDTSSGIQCFSLTHDDWNALQMVMNAMSVSEYKEVEE